MSPTADRIAFFLLGLLLGLLVGSIAFPSPAFPHDFYDWRCCSGQDCAPAPSGAVTWTPEGWAVSTPAVRGVVPFDDPRLHHSPPDEPRFHICEWPKGVLRCLYVPEGEG